MLMIQQPISRCTKILKTFHDNQPKIRKVFHAEVREKITKDRALVAPNGRRRDFFGKIDESVINEGISFLPQAIVTDYLKQSLSKTIKECREIVRPLSEAHDGFLSEVKLDYQEKYAKTYIKNIQQPIDFNSCSLSRDFQLIIPCEAEWSDENWERLSPLKV